MVLAYIDNNEIEIDELMNISKHQIFLLVVLYGYEGVREAFKTGRGQCYACQSWFEEVDGREIYRYRNSIPSQ
jgi:DNA gyrase subunit A